MQKRYLVWLDILGFDSFCKEVAEKRSLDAKKVRTDFINIINERIKIILSKQEIMGYKYGHSDDWLLVTESLDSAFKNITDILNHETGYTDLKIPLEFAIGFGSYSDAELLEGINLCINQSTIDFLKTKIIDYYHYWYRRENGVTPRTTYIVITDPVYSEMTARLQNECKKIDIHSNIFYSVSSTAIERQAKMHVFLEKIGRSNSKLYCQIDDLFVPPTEFEEIEASLKINRLVFITGTPEYGKTYIAVRLLWQYFVKGYDVVWIEGREEKERIEVRKRLEEIERELKPNHIIYFEDPFGKSNYERVESLERRLAQ